MSVARRENWSRYWSTGALHSCFGTFEGNYTGEVREFWQGAVRELAPGSKLLDIATGNGALPRLMFDLFPPEFDFELDAIDLAEIKPVWLGSMPASQRQRLRFHTGIAAERLPFVDASVDLAISQFGLEYTDLPLSLAELGRVLRPGGRVALVVHAKDSLVATQAREELSHLEWLRDEIRLPTLAKAMCGPMVKAACPEGRTALAQDASANRTREEFNIAMNLVGQRAKASPCPDVLFEAQQGVADAFAACVQNKRESLGLELLRKLAAAQADDELRLRELLDCALDQAGAGALVAQAGWALESVSAVTFGKGDLLGWGVRARSES